MKTSFFRARTAATRPPSPSGEGVAYLAIVKVAGALTVPLL